MEEKPHNGAKYLSHFIVQVSDVERSRLERSRGGDRLGRLSSVHVFMLVLRIFLIFIDFGNIMQI